jgi:hypothetical protein
LQAITSEDAVVIQSVKRELEIFVADLRSNPTLPQSVSEVKRLAITGIGLTMKDYVSSYAFNSDPPTYTSSSLGRNLAHELRANDVDKVDFDARGTDVYGPHPQTMSRALRLLEKGKWLSSFPNSMARIKGQAGRLAERRYRTNETLYRLSICNWLSVHNMMWLAGLEHPEKMKVFAENVVDEVRQLSELRYQQILRWCMSNPDLIGHFSRITLNRDLNGDEIAKHHEVANSFQSLFLGEHACPQCGERLLPIEPPTVYDCMGCHLSCSYEPGSEEEAFGLVWAEFGWMIASLLAAKARWKYYKGREMSSSQLMDEIDVRMKAEGVARRACKNPECKREILIHDITQPQVIACPGCSEEYDWNPW